MKKNKYKILLPLLLFLTVAIFIVLNTEKNRLVNYIYNQILIAVQVIRSVPQMTFIILLVLFSILCAIFSFYKIYQPPKYSPAKSPSHYTFSEYKLWLNRISGKSNSRFLNEETSNELRSFILSLLSFQNHCSSNEIKKQILEHQLDIPTPVQALFSDQNNDHTTTADETLLSSLCNKIFFRKGPAINEITDTELETIIQYIEQQLEG
ncbi:hypothetical protein QA601_16600 [Chitinispirillales bacterium ANBcel5]|uniref:hypothetical protein n=1 Tax=Cellulosispirillum alkaliphilum TaxID=3039283 RepID=UPI002A539A70|nr:hypothetical protein [Chitinispirillales bacterium ANBcel5]